MAKSYVKFEVPNEVVSRTYEALQSARQSGRIRKGANEVTKSVEKGLASFVVIAGDVDPEEVVIHLPKLCEQKKIAYSYVPNKLDLGKAIGMNVPCTAVAVENAGQAEHMIKDVISKVTGVSPKREAAEAPAPEKKEKSKADAAKKEAKRAEKQPKPAAPEQKEKAKAEEAK
jgi:large subunit ribosomal protein L7Ae